MDAVVGENSNSKVEESPNQSPPVPTNAVAPQTIAPNLSSDKPLGEDETDAEIEAMKRRVKEMEEEALKIDAVQNSVIKSPQVANGPGVDSRSIYVGNVDYSTTPEELQEFFQSCGAVNRITILCDKFSGHPKGYAYVEFKDADAIVNAMILNESEFKGRPLKISPKRTNIPGYAEPRGRGRGRPRFRRRFSGYAPRPRFRHRRAIYHPYS